MLYTSERTISDSRKIKSGDVFLAIPCTNIQNHIDQARAQGAAGIVISREHQGLAHGFSNVWVVENPRWVASLLLAKQYPKQPEFLCAVTGTNGKSSVVSFVRQIFSLLGCSSASIGTLGVEVDKGSDLYETGLTTMGAEVFYKTLHTLSESGITHAAFEASSHGLDQYRVDHARLTCAGFTNLTQDHLDYHGSMEAYRKAKMRLFTEILPDQGIAVIPHTFSYEENYKQRGHVLWYGGEDFRWGSVVQIERGYEISLHFDGKDYGPVLFPVLGQFQLENLLCAFGLIHCAGTRFEEMLSVVPFLKAPQGRFESLWIEHRHVVIDYAHTPDALERALLSLRPLTQGDLWVVWGCGGNRDVKKRPLMGAIADRLADHCIVTDDNPRFEDPVTIRRMILDSCSKAIEIGDRREAILYALRNMGDFDTLLIAGKGHETGQIIQGVTLPFRDHEVVQSFRDEG